MKRKNRINRMAAFLAAVILTTLCLSQAAFAAESAGIDTSKPVSLTIDLEAQEKVATIALYQVGEWDGSKGSYVLTSEFANSGAEIGDTTTEGMLKASQALEAYANENQLPAKTVKSTEKGKLQVTGLTTGLYLICQQKGDSDNVTISPFLTTLPRMNEITGMWDYDVTSFTKNEVIPTPTPTPNPGGSGGDGGSGGGSSGRRETSDPELVNITDEDVPLEAPTLMEQIEDMLVPLVDMLPKTGDGSVSYGSLLVILAVSGMMIFALVQRRRKRDVK